MDARNHPDDTLMVRRVSSSENHVIPATDMAALLAYAELHAIKAALIDATRAADGPGGLDSLSHLLETRFAKGAAAIAKIRNVRVRDFVADLDVVRALPADVFTSPVGAWTAGVTAGTSAAVAVIRVSAVFVSYGASGGHRQVAVSMLRRELSAAESRWSSYRDEILRAHPEIADGDPAFTLVMTDQDVPYYLVPVTA